MNAPKSEKSSFASVSSFSLNSSETLRSLLKIANCPKTFIEVAESFLCLLPSKNGETFVTIIQLKSVSLVLFRVLHTKEFHSGLEMGLNFLKSNARNL